MYTKQKWDDKKMKRTNIAGLLAIVAITAVVMFTGCVEEEAPKVTPSSAVTPMPAHNVGTPFGDRIVLGEKRYERAFTIEDVKVVTFTKGIVDECDVFGQHYTVRWFEEGKGSGVGVDEFTEVFIKVHFEDIGYDTEWAVEK